MPTILLSREFIGSDSDDDDDPKNWKEVTIPAKYEVCIVCHGEGRITNPAIDGNGLTQSDIDEAGPDFLEDYLSGVYDIVCKTCEGKRVTLTIDEDAATPEQIKEYQQQEEEKYQDEQMHRMEMMSERGYYD